MKLTTKIIAVLIMILLATPAILFEGCGTGDFCGGCPTDISAPAGSDINVIVGLADDDFLDNTFACINNVTFTLEDSGGASLNGLCIEIFSDGFIRKAEVGLCTSNTGTYVNYMRTTTNGAGALVLDFATYTHVCGTATSNVGHDYFIQVNSCTANALTTATFTLQCPP